MSEVKETQLYRIEKLLASINKNLEELKTKEIKIVVDTKSKKTVIKPGVVSSIL